MIELRVIEGQPDADRKSCVDCRHMKAAVCWWCTNQKAIKYRGTSFPGVHSCQFWEPALKVDPPKPWYKQMFDFGLERGPILIRCGVVHDD